MASTSPAPRSRALASPLLVLCVAQFVLQVDFSIVNIALRTIQEELDFSAAALQWVVTGYALTFGSLLLLGGRLGDRAGRRRLLLTGAWIFGIASLACGLAPGPGLLIAGRFVQGAGAALMAPGILAILTSVYTDGAERTRALGIWTAATAAGGTTGIVLGGVLTQWLGWRAILLVNLPLIAWLLPAVRRTVPEVRGEGAAKLDAWGAGLITAGLAALILGLSQGEQQGFGSALSTAALIAAAVLLVVFVLVERATAEPMVPAAFLRVPLRRTGVLVMATVGGLFAAYAYFIALYCQRGLGLSEIATAVALVPSPLTLVFSSMVLSRRLIPRLGLEPVMLLGLVVLAVGFGWLTQVRDGGSYAVDVLPGLIVSALGGGLLFPSASAGVTAGVGARERGLAGGLVPAAQQVGSALFLAILATIASASARDHAGAVVPGYRTAYLVMCLIVVAAAAGVAVMLLRRRSLPAPPSARPSEVPAATGDRTAA